MKKRRMEVIEMEGMKKEVPEYGVMPGVFNEGLIGKVERDEGGGRELREVNDGLNEIRDYGFSENPVVGKKRIVAVMMKVEERALQGNLNAAKMFLDRTVGAVTQKVAVGSMKFQGLSDAELLEIAKKKMVKTK